MKDSELVNYLNSIDFSLINNTEVLDNIYNEILSDIIPLSKDPFVSTSLEKLITLSSSSHLIKLIKHLDKRIVYRKLGSRLVESIYKQLFDCMYKSNEIFRLSEAIEFLNVNECVECHNATFVLRQALMLLSGKKIDKMNITKYNTQEVKLEKNDFSVFSANNEYSEKKILEIKEIFIKKLQSFESNDQFNTFGVFLQITKSQSLITTFLEKDCCVENIQRRGFLYELISTVSSKKNFNLIFTKIKLKFEELCLEEKTSYFMQSFLRNSSYGEEVYNSINLEEFDENSNIILALLESLQQSMNYKLVNQLVDKFYLKTQEKSKDLSLFSIMLLEKHSSLDSKFIKAICNFMEMPEKHSFNVTADFLKYFKNEWIKSKKGISLIIAFSNGSCDIKRKIKFFDSHIDLLWESYKWKEGKKFIKRVCGFTTGHARKKAYEILKKCT